MYNIKIRNNKTNEIKIITKNDEWFDSDFYYYSEGNFSCDCNRANLFYTKYDLGFPCGDKLFSILEIQLETGELFYPDGENI